MHIQSWGTALALVMGLWNGSSLAQASHAQDIAYGRDACTAIMAGENLSAPEGSRQRHYAKTAQVPTDALCHCVGNKFAQSANIQPEQEEFIRLERGFSQCLPHFGGLPPEVQTRIMDGPQLAQPLSPAQKAHEAQLCRNMASGRHTPPGLDTVYLRAWEQESGVQASSLCGICVEEVMNDHRERSRVEGEVWDEMRRDTYLVYALGECQHNTYRMKQSVSH